MRTLITILFILFLVGCAHETQRQKLASTGRQWVLNLENDLGTINLLLPERFDSPFPFIENGDCGDSCAFVGYRIQQKKFPLNDDSHDYSPKDSVDQFTVRQSKLEYPYNRKDTDSLKYLSFLAKSTVLNYYPVKMSIDMNLVISGRPFAVVGYFMFDSVRKIPSYHLNSMTFVNKNVIEFYFEHCVKGNDWTGQSFIWESFEYLKTIKINGR